MPADATTGKVHYGIVRVDLHLPGVASLKGRRALLNRVRSALTDGLGCSVTEVGDAEAWQRASLGVAVAASTQTGVDRVLDRITTTIERDPRVTVLGTVGFADALDDDPSLPPLPPG